jgi:hypothetical protein
MDNCLIFHPIICAKEMEDENAKKGQVLRLG